MASKNGLAFIDIAKGARSELPPVNLEILKKDGALLSSDLSDDTPTYLKWNHIKRIGHCVCDSHRMGEQNTNARQGRCLVECEGILTGRAKGIASFLVGLPLVKQHVTHNLLDFPNSSDSIWHV